MTKRSLVVLLIGASCIVSAAAPATIVVDTPMQAPAWARLERQILAAAVPACREFFQKYYDDRGYLQAFLRWGANDGPDDAFENFNRWPELHALGADDEILRIYLKAWEGMTRQYSEARTRDVPAGRDGMYVKDFSAQSDWMHHGEGLQLFNRMALSAPDLPVYRERARRFAGLYMGEDPDAPNYDPKRKLIRSMINGSKGPLLRKATALDWVGDPFDATGFVALHGENSYAQFLEHYQEYTDVVGDHFLNLVATTLPTNAYLLTGEAKYRRWIVEYMDAWLGAHAARTTGSSRASSTSTAGSAGPKGRWWGNAYGWGFSPVNPVTGRREDRNRIPRALVGFSNALLVTGDRKYVDAWREMIAAVNRHARQTEGRVEYPTMRGADGWYGWQRDPWSVGALEVWYWSMSDADRARVGANPWLEFLDGRNASYAETSLERELAGIPRKLEIIRADRTLPDKRLADNMLDANPAATDALVRLMFGALVPGPRRRPAQRPRPLFRSGAPSRRRPGRRRRARLGPRRPAHRRHAGEHQRIRAADGDRAGRRLRRAPVRVGGMERTNRTPRCPRLHRAPRTGRRRHADPGDAALRQHADGQVSVETVDAGDATSTTGFPASPRRRGLS